MWTSLGKSCSDGDVFAAASTSKKKNICDIEEPCKTEITPVQRVKRLILLLCAGWGDWRGTDMLSNQAAYNADVQAGQRVNVSEGLRKGRGCEKMKIVDGWNIQWMCTGSMTQELFERPRAGVTIRCTASESKNSVEMLGEGIPVYEELQGSGQDPEIEYDMGRPVGSSTLVPKFQPAGTKVFRGRTHVGLTQGCKTKANPSQARGRYCMSGQAMQGIFVLGGLFGTSKRSTKVKYCARLAARHYFLWLLTGGNSALYTDTNLSNTPSASWQPPIVDTLWDIVKDLAWELLTTEEVEGEETHHLSTDNAQAQQQMNALTSCQQGSAISLLVWLEVDGGSTNSQSVNRVAMFFFGQSGLRATENQYTHTLARNQNTWTGQMINVLMSYQQMEDDLIQEGSSLKEDQHTHNLQTVGNDFNQHGLSSKEDRQTHMLQTVGNDFDQHGSRGSTDVPPMLVSQQSQQVSGNFWAISVANARSR
ncbi:hypothetical protein BDR05DRAFT_947560 [Suillus weaverae]|nr:hypothetical protein BDR05DRAFT_947560 [Suillus weaverae]